MSQAPKIITMDTIEPSQWVLDSVTWRKPIVWHRFRLNDAARETVRATPYSFGFDGFGEAVYYRTYSRNTNGSQETWPDTILRVVDGVFTIRKDYYHKNRLPWDEAYWQSVAAEFAVYMVQMKFLPPGRGLWAMGTDYIYNRGSMALFNCAATEINDLVADFGWLMDALMCGCGVGFECVPSDIVLKRPVGKVGYTVEDSREGWVESTELLLRSYVEGSEEIEFDYSKIRPAGKKLLGIGGVSAGAEPLIKLHKRLRETCEAFIEGKFGVTRLKADIGNHIGCCVVVGNVRRSAEIAIGSPNDEEFLNLKNYTLNPDRADFGWMSNNSVRLESDADFEQLPMIAARIRDNGEPGILNQQAMSKFARFGREQPDKARLMNPCQPGWATVLTPDGIRTFDDISVGSIIWSGRQWTKVIQKVATGKKEVKKFITTFGSFEGTEDHRIVCNKEKLAVKDATTIDISSGPAWDVGVLNPQDVLDGLLIGDGTVHKADNRVYLIIGKDDFDYFDSEIAPLLIEERPNNHKGYWLVKSNISHSELPLTFNRTIPDRFYFGSQLTVRGFLRGLYSANGSVVGKGAASRVTLKASSFRVIERARNMLSSIGIRSYVTTNQSKDVEFSNGIYTCKKSYDLHITTDRELFLKKIGFIQNYKIDKLKQAIALRKRVTYKYSTARITEVITLGNHDVYDITVDAPDHTYWTGGLLVSNCGEIPLESKELCNLAEVFPTKCNSEEEFYKACEFASLYCSTVTLLPTHRPETNRIIARNRRIGVSISGVMDWMARERSVANMTRIMRKGYKIVKETNARLATEAGIPPSIRVTTIKPSGTISQLVGCSSGAHSPTFDYATRRMRVAAGSTIERILRDAGYHCEPDTYSENTTVVSFPINQGSIRTATQVSIWEQALVLCTLQREWSDNAVSVTLYFDPETESDEIEHVLAQVAPMVKSLSVLPHTKEGVYAQSPYSSLSKEEYEQQRAALRPVDWSTYRGDGEDDKYCNGDKCEIPKRG